MKILIAEDDFSSRQLLAMTLEKMGHEVIVSEDGAQAWKVWLETRIQVVITDWMMPGMTGLEFCRHIRDEDSRGYTFLILLTVKEDQKSYHEAFDAGVDDFLSKPFDKSELEGRLRSAQRILEMESRISDQNADLEKALLHIRKDLEAAANIQQSLLPKDLDRIGCLDFSWRLEPCEHLAGDIFNVIPLNEHQTGIYLLDVSGHGVAAALMSVTLSRIMSLSGDDSFLFCNNDQGDSVPAEPSDILEKLNQRFQIDVADDFSSMTMQYFTMFYGIFDQRTGEFRYCFAGNPPVLFLRSSGLMETLSTSSFAVGFIDEPAYKTESVMMDPGDCMVLFSDGLFEIPNENNELYGVERLSKDLKSIRMSTGHCTIDLVCEQLMHRARSWRGDEELLDDISLLVFRVLKEEAANDSSDEG